jgi:predicted amidohydrolase YtcJ
VAFSAWKVILPWTDDVDELLSFITGVRAEPPADEVPYFFGMYYRRRCSETTGPTKELLDSYVSDRPVRLQDFSDHCSWVNSRALELMGVDKDTPDRTRTSYFVRDARAIPPAGSRRTRWPTSRTLCSRPSAGIRRKT